MNKVKVLLAIPRKKDNTNVTCESMQHRKCFKRVWSEPEEREKCLNELRTIAKCYPEYKWRIYETINWRDLRKTWYEYQKTILDWQRSDPNGQMEWLDKVHSEWISAMMQPESCASDGKLFMLDKDDKNDVDYFKSVLQGIGIKIKEQYETPGGVHFLVEPFNIIELQKECIKINIIREIANPSFVVNDKFINEALKNYGNIILKKVFNAELHKDGLRFVEMI